MPLCLPSYELVEIYLDDLKILIKKSICTIVSERDIFGDSVVVGGPAVLAYTVSMRTPTALKTAYVKLGNVPLGWFNSTLQQGIYIKEIPLPKQFRWKISWPSLEKLVDCNIPARIEEEFGIKIGRYLGAK